MQKKSSTYEKLCDIKDFPDLGGEPEMLETTTLSDPVQTFIMGIQSSDSMAFTMNYNPRNSKRFKKQELNLNCLYGSVVLKPQVLLHQQATLENLISRVQSPFM